MKKILLALIAASALPLHAQRIAINPAIPAYGQPITIEVKDAAPMYLPATRYRMMGSTIVVDFEFGQEAARPDFGSSALSLGELPAGNYTVQARLFDIARPWNPTAVVNANLPVVPPAAWGIYSVPQEPSARGRTHAMIRSAAYFDAASMKATVAGNVVRVDFTYDSSAPATGTTPPGLTTFASVELPPLRAGTYQFEGWGKPASGGAYERYFSKAVQVSAAVPVVEYYSRSLDHYFISAGADEIALVDRGGMGDWMRTGQSFLAWPTAADAPPGAVPVCRFYARGPNSHFYTGSAKECEELRAIEHAQRQEAQARGEPFLGWAYETVAFYAVLPQYGQCPAGLEPVWRAYNGRAAQMDSNHRFTTDAGQRAAMGESWLDEGAHLCAAAD